MLILFAKYTLFMCLAIISDNSNCDKKLYEASTGGEIYWKASCTAKCLLEETNKNFSLCFDFCQSKENSHFGVDLKKINESHDLVLLCRDDRSITLKVIAPTAAQGQHQLRLTEHSNSLPFKTKYNTTNWTLNNKTQEIYVVNISMAKDAKEISVYLSDENIITIGNLSQNTTYNISVAVVYASQEYSIIAKSRQFRTLRRGYKPRDIQKISLIGYAADESDSMLLTAYVSWKPSYDMTCRYALIFYSPESRQGEMEVTQITDAKDLYVYKLDNLTFSTAYNIGIRAMNTNDTSKESNLMWEKIKTPSCTEWHNMNFNICAPFKPEGLAVKEQFVLPNQYSLNISWEYPLYRPNYYTLLVLDLDQVNLYNVNKHDYNVSKDENWFFIPNITLNGMLLEVHLTAHTGGGTSTAVLSTSINKPHLVSVSPDRNYVFLKLGLAIFAPLVCVVFLVLAMLMVCHRRAKLKRFQERCRYFEELEKKAPIDPKSTFEFTKMLNITTTQLDLDEKMFFNDDMEINRDDVKLYEILGEGAFGLVRRGIFYNKKLDLKDDCDGNESTKEVAVKMLKDNPSLDDIRAFRREIEVMKSVGSHPNIVGIVGHYTRKCNEMLLLTEYCSLGNLLIFLRNEWKYLHDLSFRATKHPLKTSKEHQYPISSETPLTLSKTEKTNPTVNEFNFDSKALQEMKFKYKNVNPTSSNASTAYNTKNEVDNTNLKQPIKKQYLAKFNQSYGYEDICTNACKCRVNIISSPSTASSATFIDTNSSNNNVKNETFQRGQIKISSKCECKLKRTRTKVISIDNEGYYKNLTYQTTMFVASNEIKNDKKSLTNVIPRNYETETETENHIAAKRVPLRTADLLEIAKQVALGMEFLSKNKVVHRDLAARNILVSADRTVKIADFGLSRDVYQENVYKKTGNGKLPIKWLALESMTHQVYTSQSDVWSFGILLYEIITLGGIPYPSIPTNRLIHLLKTGYRMERPKSCSHGLYELMLACWNFNPSERPNFNEIIKILDNLSMESPQLSFKTSTTSKEMKSPETPSSDESYLKPL